MRMLFGVVFCLATFTCLTGTCQDEPHVIQHVDVYKATGRFAGWPANNGIWNWGDEIVVGFTLGYHKDKEGHTIDPERPSGPMQARSLDGGETWEIETPSFADEEQGDQESPEFSGQIDFTQPDFAARFRQDRVYYSRDRCHHWEGPFQLPHFGRPGLLARTDYIVEGPQQLTAFVSAQKDSGGEGQPLCIRTTDGGKTWGQVGWIGPQPPSGYGYAIMPATLAIDGGGYLSMIRRGGIFDGTRRWWFEAFVSPNAGQSWYKLDEPNINNAGNPATLTRLDDGRIVLVYGWRHDPTGIRARISNDEGQSWSDEFSLRADGGNWDLGYPRTVRLPGNKLVTIYYFNDNEQVERYIAATIWHPGS